MKILFLLLLICTVSCTHLSKKGSQTPKKIALDIKEMTLPNGLRVIAINNNAIPSVAFYTFFNVGGVNEEGTNFGGAHFLEHMMFKGSKLLPNGDFSQILENFGGVDNAYTMQEMTVYHSTLPKSALPKIMEYEADRMRNLLLEKNSFEQERKVILEEKKMRVDNNPYAKIYWTSLAEMFPSHPYGRLLIGEDKDLEAITQETMINFYKKYYSPQNAIIVVSGDVSAGHVFDLVKKNYGGLKNDGSVAALETKAFSPAKRVLGREINLMAGAEHPLFNLSFPGFKRGVREGYLLDLITAILIDGDSSYLTKLFVRGKAPLLANISGSNRTLAHDGILSISGELLAKTHLEEFKKSFFETLPHWCEEAITERNLQKVKNQFLIAYYKEVQTNDGTAELVGSGALLTGDPMIFEKELQIYESVKRDEMVTLCKSIVKKENSIFITARK